MIDQRSAISNQLAPLPFGHPPEYLVSIRAKSKGALLDHQRDIWGEGSGML